MRQLVMLIILVIVLAACGSSNDDAIPTVFVLPTGDPSQEASQTPEAIQPTATVEAAEAVGPTVVPNTPLPFLTLRPTGEGISEDEIAAVLPFLSGSAVPSETVWLVSSETSVKVYDCPETTCTVLAELENSTEVEVVESGPVWFTIELGAVNAYIEAQYLSNTTRRVGNQLPFGGNLPGGPISTLPGNVSDSLLATQRADSPRPELTEPFTPPPSGDLPPGVNIVPSTPSMSLPELLATAAAQGDGD